MGGYLAKSVEMDQFWHICTWGSTKLSEIVTKVKVRKKYHSFFGFLNDYLKIVKNHNE